MQNLNLLHMNGIELIVKGMVKGKKNNLADAERG